MYVSCHEKVTPNWIADDDDIYIMVECMYVSKHLKGCSGPASSDVF